MEDNTNSKQLILEPIGHITTPFRSKAEAPHQPDPEQVIEGVIELNAGQNFEQALEDLDGMEKIWLLYWFDRNPNWKPKVLVPRGPRQKRGVFATRSPHRPNPIGLSLVDLISIDGLMLRVRNVDLLDGTPILDIKPYLPSIEAHPEAFAGWISEMENAALTESYSILYSDLAHEQLEFLKKLGTDLQSRLERILKHDPHPHPYKRIEQNNDSYTMAIRGWRIDFSVAGRIVMVKAIRSGYAEDQFLSGEVLSDDASQRDFKKQFSS